MGIIQNLRESAITRLGGEPDREGVLGTLSLMRESMNDLALRLRREDAGWAPLGNGSTFEEFGAEQRRNNSKICRMFAVNDPLAKQGLGIRAAYVWGTGLGITATDPAVNEVIQGFLDDPMNRAAFTGHTARLKAESALGTDGNVFLSCFTDPRTGIVQVRTLPAGEVVEIHTNPHDAAEVWFYERSYLVDGRQVTTLYPALSYRPAVRPRIIDGVPVEWSAPVYHVHDNAPAGWQYGVPDLYPAVDWLRSYKGFLTDWAKLTKAISTIAYKITGKNKSDVMAARAGMQQAMASGQPGGALAMTGADIQSMPTSGAKIESTSGDPLARMVAAALGIPITQLLGDPGSTGARAVAETLTKPMVLRFQNRRELWAEAYRAILNHVIDAHIAARDGSLNGTVKRVGDRLKWSLAGDAERTLVFDWPEIEEITLADILTAIEKLDATGLAPKDTLARLALRALKVRDVDELIDSMRDGEGNFIPAGASVSDALLASYQDGVA